MSQLVNTDLMELVRFCQANQISNDASSPTIPNLEESSREEVCGESDLDLKAILDVLTRQLQRGRVDTKLAALKWIRHLYSIAREKVNP